MTIHKILSWSVVLAGCHSRSGPALFSAQSCEKRRAWHGKGAEKPVNTSTMHFRFAYNVGHGRTAEGSTLLRLKRGKPQGDARSSGRADRPRDSPRGDFPVSLGVCFPVR